MHSKTLVFSATSHADLEVGSSTNSTSNSILLAPNVALVGYPHTYTSSTTDWSDAVRSAHRIKLWIMYLRPIFTQVVILLLAKLAPSGIDRTNPGL